VVFTSNVSRGSCCAAAIWLVMPAVAAASAKSSEADGAEAVAVEPIELPLSVFADSEVSLRFLCRGVSRVPWQVMVNGQTLARGVLRVASDRVEIRFRTPPVKPHVALPLQLAVGGAEHKITVFSRDVLSDRRRWAEGLAVSLYDPPGETAKALDRIEFPYRRLTNLGSLSTVARGMVVVGEGIDLENQRGLDQTLYQIATGGVPVLLLAPAAGSLAAPDRGPERFELRAPAVGRLIEPCVINDLERKTGFVLAVRSGRPVLQVIGEPRSYAWIDLEFNAARARFVAIGWGLLDGWDDYPAPRYFFVALLEILSQGRDVDAGKK